MNDTIIKRMFDNATGFAVPFDPSVLSAGRRAPPAFPTYLFSPRVSKLMTDLAQGTSAPVDYVAGSMLAATAAMIGGTRRVRAYEGQNWTEPCIMWVGLVGEPSSGKSPALDEIIAPLRVIEQGMARDHEDALRQWEADAMSAKIDGDAWTVAVKEAKAKSQTPPAQPEGAVAPQKPVRARLVVNDTTPESIGAILARNQRVLSNRDELAGWFDGFARYAPGGRSFWIESYGGRPYTIDRKSEGGSIKIPFNGVSVIGGIQPDRLVTVVLTGDDDGLPARFLWIWPQPVPYERPIQKADYTLLTRIFDCLTRLAFGTDDSGEPVPVVLPLDAEAADMLVDWCRATEGTGDVGGPLYKGFVGKLRGLVLRISLVVTMLDWAEDGGPEPTVVSGSVFARVRDFLEHYATPMALRVFGDAALAADERNAATLARNIIRTQATRINLRDIRRGARLPGLSDPTAVGNAVTALVEAGWLLEAPSRAGDTSGRKRKDYIVNPSAHEVDHGPLE